MYRLKERKKLPSVNLKSLREKMPLPQDIFLLTPYGLMPKYVNEFSSSPKLLKHIPNNSNFFFFLFTRYILADFFKCLRHSTNSFFLNNVFIKWFSYFFFFHYKNRYLETAFLCYPFCKLKKICSCNGFNIVLWLFI